MDGLLDKKLEHADTSAACHMDPSNSCWSSFTDGDISSGQTLMSPTVQPSTCSESEDFCMDVEFMEADVSLRYLEILSRPGKIDLEQDKIRIRSWKQERSNTRLAQLMQPVSRQDHHIMLRILIGEAYFNDPDHVNNRQRWAKVMSRMSNRFDGAAAILSWSPDPYNDVLGALSRMRLWSNSQRKWDNVNFEPRTREIAILERLKRSGKKFLDEVDE